MTPLFKEYFKFLGLLVRTGRRRVILATQHRFAILLPGKPHSDSTLVDKLLAAVARAEVLGLLLAGALLEKCTERNSTRRQISVSSGDFAKNMLLSRPLVPTPSSPLSVLSLFNWSTQSPGGGQFIGEHHRNARFVGEAVCVLQCERGNLLRLVVDPGVALRFLSIRCQQFVAKRVENLELILPSLSEEPILGAHPAILIYN